MYYSSVDYSKGEPGGGIAEAASRLAAAGAGTPHFRAAARATVRLRQADTPGPGLPRIRRLPDLPGTAELRQRRLEPFVPDRGRDRHVVVPAHSRNAGAKLLVCF